MESYRLLSKCFVMFSTQLNSQFNEKTRSALGRAHLPPTTVFRHLKTTRCSFDFPPIPVRAWDFPDVIKFHCCSAYAMGERNPVPASELWSGSGSKVNQFFHVPTSVDSRHATFHPNPCTRFWVILHTDRQTDKRARACEQKHILPPLSEVKNLTGHYRAISNKIAAYTLKKFEKILLRWRHENSTAAWTTSTPHQLDAVRRRNLMALAVKDDQSERCRLLHLKTKHSTLFKAFCQTKSRIFDQIAHACKSFVSLGTRRYNQALLA